MGILTQAQQPQTISHQQPTCWVERLDITNYRNISHIRIETIGECVALTGHNGAGKTNILEALSFLSAGRGIRGASLGDIAPQPGNGNWAVAATLSLNNQTTKIGTGTGENTDSRIIKIDGELVRSQQALAEYVGYVYLTPQISHVFLEGRSACLSYFDRLVGLFHPDHSKQMAIYDHARRERQKLLMRQNADVAWLSTLETRMSEQAMAIAASRLEVAERLSDTQIDSEAFPHFSMSVTGDAEDLLKEHKALDAENVLKARYAHTRDDDSYSGKTAIGTHRSHWQVVHSKHQMPAHLCSTGEQKILLLGIVLSACTAKQQATGRAPLLLLDEVVAHLDASIRTALFEAIHSLNVQAWMTGTDMALFSGFPRVLKQITIENGAVIG